MKWKDYKMDYCAFCDNDKREELYPRGKGHICGRCMSIIIDTIESHVGKK